MKKLSIITVNYNNVEGLRHTLASVATQSCLDIEHVIVDAASTDGSVDIIHAYADQMALYSDFSLIWSSEKDGGIYDGMNKGIQKATGEYLLFLNSGDALASGNVIEQILSFNFHADIVIGSVSRCKEGTVQTIQKAPKKLTLYSLYLEGICHQAALIKHSLFEHYGFYDVRYRICADWAFFLKAIIIKNCSVKTIEMIFCNYDLTGVSSTHTDKLLAERKQILEEILPQRIVEDYQAVFPHYYEVTRLEWLLRHPAWYRLYRGFVTIGRKILGIH